MLMYYQGNFDTPPPYSSVTPSYGYRQQNQPLLGQQYHYPGQRVVYGQPQAGPSVAVAYPGQPIAPSQRPPDYMTQAVIVTFCCFLPTGLLAIMRASEARSAVNRGDLASAQEYARSAKSMINVSIGIGILTIVIVGVFVGVIVGVFVNAMPDGKPTPRPQS